MIFKCKNCSGNVVYSPERHRMFCPFCESEESQERQYSQGGDIALCPNCGGELPVLEHTSATQCPYCENYIILNERVEGAYLPMMLIPFQLEKETCKKMIRDKFQKCVFAPTDFLSEVRLNSMQGTYVPFWFFDYNVNMEYQAEGIKVRSWSSGDMRYTETSYYDVYRNMNIQFQNIPVDASVDMPDDVMDLMEPYQYEQMVSFAPEYMSGFYAEKYNMTPDQVEARARKKMTEDSNQLLRAECGGYNSLRPKLNELRTDYANQRYGLLPVWKYIYRYKDQDYPFYVNGQTGKIVGNAPISADKVWAYAGTLWLCLTILFGCVGIWASLL